MPLPSGIVTFVFTDIEGSTRLLRRLGDGYANVLDRHRELLRAAWQNHDGIEVETEGDSVLAAFSDGHAALVACADAQRALLNEHWPKECEVRVRMGVHSGLAYPREGAYVAMAVHQAARVVSAAHGCQVLVSEQTAEMANELAELSLTPLGRFRLRDFDKPVQLLQVTGAGLPSEFASLRALPADGHNLVRPPTSFIGRDDSLAALAKLLGPGRMVSVVGPGGVGKTRLVTELGLQVAPLWRDGVWFIDLSPLQDGGHIAGAVATAVGCSVAANAEPWQAVLEQLRQQKALLIFDNCEHLVEPIAHLIAELNRECRDVGILATTREPLGPVGEQVWRLAPLGTLGDTITPAAQLFAERAKAVRVEFELDAINTPIVTTICERLDGLPLGIELAAARVGVLSPQEILKGLDDRFRLLRHRDRAVPERQRTLEALLDWSYRLLSDDEQAALRRLGVFAGSFNLETATAAFVAEPLETYDVPDLIWSLAEKSLITVEPTGNATRYRLLDSVRAYALARLRSRKETRQVAVRIADWYLGQLAPWGANDNADTRLRELELENLRGLIVLLSDSDQTTAQSLASWIARFHRLRGSVREGINEVENYANRLTNISTARVSLLTDLVELLVDAGASAKAQQFADAAAALGETVETPSWTENAVHRAISAAALSRADYSTALRTAQHALAATTVPQGRTTLLSVVTIAAAKLGDLQIAHQAAEESLAIDTKLERLGSIAIDRGNLAEITMLSGDLQSAARHQRAALLLGAQAGMLWLVAYSMIFAARMANRYRGGETCVRLHAKAESILKELGRVMFEDDRRISEDMLNNARSYLGDDQYEAERCVGAKLSLPEAIELADKVLLKVALDSVDVDPSDH